MQESLTFSLQINCLSFYNQIFRKILIESHSHETIGHIYGNIFPEFPVLSIFSPIYQNALKL